MKTKKLLTLLLSIVLTIASILGPIEEAKASSYVGALPFNMLRDEVKRAILTLIAGGFVGKNDDILIDAALAYLAGDHPLGIILGMEFRVLGEHANAAYEHITNHETQLHPTNFSMYGNVPLGTIFGPTATQSSATGPDHILFEDIPVETDYLCLNSYEINGWQGMKDWVESGTDEDPHQAILKMTATNYLGYYQIKINKTYFEIAWEGGWTMIFYPWDLQDISKVRFSVESVMDTIANVPTLDIGFQFVSDCNGPNWQWEAPLISHVPPTGITLKVNTNTLSTVNALGNFPLYFTQSDYEQSAAYGELTCTMPETWDQVVNKSAADLAGGEPPEPPTTEEPTTILEYLHDFWNWFTNLPAKLAAAIMDSLANMQFIKDLQSAFSLTTPINLEPLNFSSTILTSRFPFSLPWDISNALNMLNVQGSFEPFQVTFYNPLKIMVPGAADIPFTIDPTPFTDVLVPIVRAGFLIIFGIGLIMLTPKFFGGAS